MEKILKFDFDIDQKIDTETIIKALRGTEFFKLATYGKGNIENKFSFEKGSAKSILEPDWILSLNNKAVKL